MISADWARFESRNGKIIKDIETELEKAVRKAISQGLFFCSVDIKIDTSTEIRDRIKQDMEDLGYKITITDSRNSHAPIDQSNWYDIITLKWD